MDLDKEQVGSAIALLVLLLEPADGGPASTVLEFLHSLTDEKGLEGTVDLLLGMTQLNALILSMLASAVNTTTAQLLKDIGSRIQLGGDGTACRKPGASAAEPRRTDHLEVPVRRQPRLREVL